MLWCILNRCWECEVKNFRFIVSPSTFARALNNLEMMMTPTMKVIASLYWDQQKSISMVPCGTYLEIERKSKIWFDSNLIDIDFTVTVEKIPRWTSSRWGCYLCSVQRTHCLDQVQPKMSEFIAFLESQPTYKMFIDVAVLSCITGGIRSTRNTIHHCSHQVSSPSSLSFSVGVMSKSTNGPRRKTLAELSPSTRTNDQRTVRRRWAFLSDHIRHDPEEIHRLGRTSYHLLAKTSSNCTSPIHPITGWSNQVYLSLFCAWSSSSIAEWTKSAERILSRRIDLSPLRTSMFFRPERGDGSFRSFLFSKFLSRAAVELQQDQLQHAKRVTQSKKRTRKLDWQHWKPSKASMG